MDDFELDNLFARAREETPADAEAAERFLIWHRAAPLTGVPTRRQAAWWPWPLACAAVLAGLLVARPAPALPSSAAYEAYHGVLGEGW